MPKYEQGSTFKRVEPFDDKTSIEASIEMSIVEGVADIRHFLTLTISLINSWFGVALWLSFMLIGFEVTSIDDFIIGA